MNRRSSRDRYSGRIRTRLLWVASVSGDTFRYQGVGPQLDATMGWGGSEHRHVENLTVFCRRTADQREHVSCDHGSQPKA